MPVWTVLLLFVSATAFGVGERIFSETMVSSRTGLENRQVAIKDVTLTEFVSCDGWEETKNRAAAPFIVYHRLLVRVWVEEFIGTVTGAIQIMDLDKNLPQASQVATYVGEDDNGFHVYETRVQVGKSGPLKLYARLALRGGLSFSIDQHRKLYPGYFYFKVKLPCSGVISRWHLPSPNGNGSRSWLPNWVWQRLPGSNGRHTVRSSVGAP